MRPGRKAGPPPCAAGLRVESSVRVQPSRWHHILDTQPIPVVDHLVAELGKLFAKELARWPPSLDALDEGEGAGAGAQLRRILEEHPAKPDPRAFREAFRLANFDVARDLGAYDDYVRNRRWLEAGLAPGDKELVLFLARLVTEHLWGLAEHTTGHLSRVQLGEVLRQTERRFFDGELS